MSNDSSKKGVFITLEGIEGAGKSIQLDYIASLFEKAGRDVVITREPGGTQSGERIRELLLDTSITTLNADTELMLMFAARAQHVYEIIQPALSQNKIVISDRFADASYAYQGGGRGISSERIDRLYQWCLGEFKPDLTFLFDIEPGLGLERAGKRGRADRFETEQNAFFESVRKEYLRLAAEEPERIKIIDASTSIDLVQNNIKQLLQELELCH